MRAGRQDRLRTWFEEEVLCGEEQEEGDEEVQGTKDVQSQEMQMW